MPEASKRIVSVACCLMMFVGMAASITNVRAVPRWNTGIVDVYYDLYSKEGGYATISLEPISDNDDVVMKSLSGHVGSYCRPGKDRHITWDARADNGEKNLLNLRVCISATIMDQDPDPGMAWIPQRNCDKYVIKNVNAGIYGGKYSDSWTYTSGGGFYADRQPVSYALWYKVYSWAVQHGYRFKKSYSSSGSGSAISVNCYDAWVWCNARSSMEGLPPCHYTDGAPSYVSKSATADTPTYSDERKGGYYIPNIPQLAYLMHIGGSKGMGASSSGFVCRGSGPYFASGCYLSHVSGDVDTYAVGVHYYTSTYPLWCVRSKVDRYPVDEKIPGNFSNLFSIDYSQAVNLPLVSDFRIEQVKSKYFRGRYGQGDKATFLSGVSLDVDIELTLSGGELSRVFVNDEEYYSDKVRINVGNFPVGAEVIVRAVSTEGRFTAPYRLNFDIAEPPGKLYGIRQENNDSVIYGSGEFATLPIFEGLGKGLFTSDDMEFRIFKDGEPVKMSFGLSLRLNGDVNSKDGKLIWRTGVGVGGVAPFCRFGMLSVYGEFTGTPVSQWDPRACVWERVTDWFGYKFGGKASWRHDFVPGILSAKLSAKSDNYLGGTWGEGLSYAFDGDVLALVLTGTLGVSGLASVEVFGEGGVHVGYDTADVNNCEIYLYGEYGRYATFLGKHFFDKKSKRFKYPSDEELPSYEELIGDPDPEEVKDGVPTPSDRSYLTGGEDGTATKPYLIGQGVVVTNSSYNSIYVQKTLIQRNGTPHPDPTMSETGICGGATSQFTGFMGFDNPSRGERNKDELGTVEDDGAGHYKVGGRIWNDGTADHKPTASTTKGGTSIVSWMNGGAVLPDDATFGEEMAGMEIAVAEKSVGEDGWRARNLTDDDAFDHSPIVCAWGDASATVVWIRNEYTNYLGSAQEPNKIMHSDYDGSSWSEPSPVVASTGKVRGISFVAREGFAALSYCESSDGGDTSVAKIVLRMSGEWGDPFVLDDALVQRGCVPQLVVGTNGNVIAFWTKEDVLHAAEIDEDGKVSETMIDINGEAAPVEFVVTSNSKGSMAIVWAGPSILDPGISVPMVMTYNPEIGMWSLPSRLFDRGTFAPTTTIRCPAAAYMGDDSLKLTYAESPVDQEISSDKDERIASVAVTTVRHAPDIGVDSGSVVVEPSTFDVGDEIKISFDIKNYGDEVASNARLQCYFWGQRSALLVSETVPLIGVRETKRYELLWTATMASDPTTEIYFSTSMSGDRNSYNNSLYFYLDGAAEAKPIVALSSAAAEICESNTCRVVATVRNEGSQSLPRGAIATFRKGDCNGEVLGQDEIGNVAVGEAGQVDVVCSIAKDRIDDGGKYDDVFVSLALPENAANAIGLSLTSTATVHDNVNKGYALILKSADENGDDKLLSCKYDKVDTIPLVENLAVDRVFEGWAVAEKGAAVYKDGAQFSNLPMYEPDRAILYPVWNVPIPQVSLDAGADVVREALAGSADSTLAKNITDASVYGSYREWAINIGVVDVKASPYAWVSFATDSAALLAKMPTDDDLKVEEFKPSAMAGSFDFTVSVKDVTIGDKVSVDNLKKLFGLEGAESLDSAAFSSEKVALDFKEPQDGKLKFSATPAVDNAKSFFMKVKIK